MPDPNPYKELWDEFEDIKKISAPSLPESVDEEFAKNLQAVLAIAQDKKSIRAIDIKGIFGDDIKKAADYLAAATQAPHEALKLKTGTLGSRAARYELVAPAAPAAPDAKVIAKKDAVTIELEKKLAKNKERLRELSDITNKKLPDEIEIATLRQRIAKDEYKIAVLPDSITDDDQGGAIYKAADEYIKIGKDLNATYKEFEKDPASADVLKNGVLHRELTGLVGLRDQLEKYSGKVNSAFKKYLRGKFIEIELLLTQYARDYQFLIPGRDDEKLVAKIDEALVHYGKVISILSGFVDRYDTALKDNDESALADVARFIDQSKDDCDDQILEIKRLLPWLTKAKRSEIEKTFETQRDTRNQLAEKIRNLDVLAHQKSREKFAREKEARLAPVREQIEQELEKYPDLLDAFEKAINKYDSAVSKGDVNALVALRGDDGESGELGEASARIQDLRDAIAAIGDEDIRHEIYGDHNRWKKYDERLRTLKGTLKNIEKKPDQPDLIANGITRIRVEDRLRVASDLLGRFEQTNSDDQMRSAFDDIMDIAKDLIDRQLTIRPETQTAYDALVALHKAKAPKKSEVEPLLQTLVKNLREDSKTFFAGVYIPMRASNRLSKERISQDREMKEFLQPLGKGAEAFDNPEFQSFLNDFEAVNTTGDDAERFRKARNAFELYQNAVRVIGVRARARIEQDFKFSMPTAGMLAIVSELREQAISDMPELQRRIEVFNELKDIEQDNAQQEYQLFKSLDLEPSDIDGLKETLKSIEDRQKNLSEQKARGEADYHKLDSSNESFRSAKLENMQTRISQIAQELHNINLSYAKLKDTIDPIEKAEELKKAIEKEFANVRKDIFRFSAGFQEATAVMARRVNEVMMRRLETDFDPSMVEEAEEKVVEMDTLRSSTSDYIQVPEIMAEADAIEKKLIVVVEKRISEAIEKFSPKQGATAELKKVIGSYARGKDTALGIIDKIISNAAPDDTDEQKDKITQLKIFNMELVGKL